MEQSGDRASCPEKRPTAAVKFRILNRGNRVVIALTKESQGVMYYRGQ